MQDSIRSNVVLFPICQISQKLQSMIYLLKCPISVPYIRPVQGPAKLFKCTRYYNLKTAISDHTGQNVQPVSETYLCLK